MLLLLSAAPVQNGTPIGLLLAITAAASVTNSGFPLRLLLALTHAN